MVRCVNRPKGVKKMSSPENKQEILGAGWLPLSTAGWNMWLRETGGDEWERVVKCCHEDRGLFAWGFG